MTRRDPPHLRTYTATQEVLGNVYGDPNHYLGCHYGPPLDGMRCGLDRMGSPNRPLILYPEDVKTPHEPPTDPEPWNVLAMAVEFMGENSGIGDGSWPPGTEFNSTLLFIVEFPFGLVQCAANWEYTRVPTKWFDCKWPGVQFSLSPPSTGRLTEAAFTLSLLYQQRDK
jgi:hypothetical protein